jgi:hypothetical protein
MGAPVDLVVTQKHYAGLPMVTWGIESVLFYIRDAIIPYIAQRR